MTRLLTPLAAVLIALLAAGPATARTRTDPRLRHTLVLVYAHQSQGGFQRDLGDGRVEIRREAFQLHTAVRLKPNSHGKASATAILKRTNGGGDDNIYNSPNPCDDVSQAYTADRDSVAKVTLTVGRAKGRRLPPITVTLDPGDITETVSEKDGCGGPAQDKSVTWWHDNFDRFYGNDALARPFAARITKWKPGRGNVIAEAGGDRAPFPEIYPPQRGREGFWQDSWALTEDF